MIDTHTDGRHLDEKGLGRALFTEFGPRTDRVTRVFERLDVYDHTNADDVGRYYVGALSRNPRSHAARAVARDEGLIALLTRIFNTGVRSHADAACIRFLHGLR